MKERATMATKSWIRDGTWLVLSLLLGSTGCRGLQPREGQSSTGPVQVASVGPATGGRTGLFSANEGYLRVYSSTETRLDGGIAYSQHTPYVLAAPDGTRVQGVPNRVGPTDQRPMTVPLKPGAYVVTARADGYGRIRIPVVIVGARLTEVHLERGGMETLGDLPEAEAVRLPDGRIIGRQAPPSTPAGPALP